MKKFIFLIGMLTAFFGCQVHDEHDTQPVSHSTSEHVVDAVFIDNHTSHRVNISEGIQLQVITRGPRNRRLSQMRFLVDRRLYPNVAGLEIISLSVGNVFSTPEIGDAIVLEPRNKKGSKANLMSPVLRTTDLTGGRLGFSLLDSSGDYIDDAFFDLVIEEVPSGELEVSFQFSVSTSFGLLLTGTGGDVNDCDDRDDVVIWRNISGTSLLRQIAKITGISEKQLRDSLTCDPFVIFETTNKEEANQLKAALEAVGATVDLKRMPQVEQTEFDVILSSAGAEKFKVIQTLQSELKISDKEAISLLEKMPIVILARASKEEANQLKAALEAVGATVDLK